MKKEYTKEFKQHVVGEHFAGSTISALAKEYSLSRNTVYSWIEQHGKEIKRTKPINMREYNDLTLWLTLCTITAGSLPEAEQRNSTLGRKSVNNLQQHIN